MNPLERALAILLLLTRKRLLPASELAERFEVSVRTIYRDIDRLIALGIPIEAERGAEGGFRLSSDYLSPPDRAQSDRDDSASHRAHTGARIADDTAEIGPRNR